MTAPAPDRRCGTCQWWGHPDMEAMGKRPCEWPLANLPWVMRQGPIDWSGPDDGGDCAMWSVGGLPDDE